MHVRERVRVRVRVICAYAGACAYQGEFNRLARLEWNFRDTKGLSDPALFHSYKNKVVGGVLPLALFSGGHNYFVSQMAQRNGWEPYSIHTTYQYAAAAGKRHRLREAGVWIDPPEYYDPPGGLLRFDIDQPAGMVKPAGGMTVKGHIDLVSHQLRQIRAALALATALKRVLVLPAVICGYDKYWGPLDKAPSHPPTLYPPIPRAHSSPCAHIPGRSRPRCALRG